MDKFKSMNKKTKLIAIIVIVALVLASAFAAYSIINDKGDASETKGETVQTSSEKETKADVKVENKVDGSSKDKEKSDADKSKEDADNNEAGEKADSVTTSSTSKPSSNTSKVESSGSTTKPAVSKPSSSSGASTVKPSDKNNSSTTKPSTSKPNNNTSSGNSSSNSSSKPDKPSHTHNWQPVYETVTKYTTELVTKYYCNGKYFDDYASGYDYFDWCTDNAISASLHPVDIEVEVSYEDEVLVGYKCSCGATKSNS